MPGTSVITKGQEFMGTRKCVKTTVESTNLKSDTNSLSSSSSSSSSSRDGKSSNLKENKCSSCCCCGGGGGGGANDANGIRGCDRSRMRLVDEKDFRQLMLVIDNQQKCSKNGYNPFGANHNEWAQFYSFPRLLVTNNTNENRLDPFVLQPSLFHKNHVPPVIYFNTKLFNDSRPPIGLPKRLQYYFKWKISSITPNSIRNCISFMNFDTIKPSNTTDTLYLGSWCKHMLTAEFSHLEEWKKVNHYPGSFHLGRKDKLWFRFRTADLRYGRERFGNFHPTTFVLPQDYDELRNYWNNSPSKLFIMKPPASARGNGIKVINDIHQIPASALALPIQADGMPSKKSTMIVQQYIANPCLLENGQKFDLRVYVLLTSVDPLRVYIYDEGLVRFASTKYTSQEDGIINQYMHLTNYFINKNNQEYQINNDCDSLNGCKWTLKRFWRYLREHYKHVDVEKLSENIEDIIIKTIIFCEGPMTRLSHQNCKNDYTSYELFGFDIILDENFKPWILEVNITPSLKSESDLDTSVKYGVIKDMFNLVGYNLPPVSVETSQLESLADCKLFFDRRLYTENLTKRDKFKHSKYQKLFKGEQHHHQPQEWIPLELKYNNDHLPSVEMEQSLPVNQVPKIEGLETNGLHRASSNNDNVDHANPKLSSATILNDLTQNDIRVLMLTEDELSRCGKFKRVFPSPTSHKYLEYFDKPRYYNLLLDAWEQKYHNNRSEGISRLSNLGTFLN